MGARRDISHWGRGGVFAPKPPALARGAPSPIKGLQG